MALPGTILGDLGMVCAIIDHPPASSNTAAVGVKELVVRTNQEGLKEGPTVRG